MSNGERRTIGQDVDGETAPRPVARRRSTTRWAVPLLLTILAVGALMVFRLTGTMGGLGPLPMPTASVTITPTAISSPTATGTATPTQTVTATPQPVVHVGGLVVVNGTGNDQLRLRHDPGVNTATLRTMTDETLLRVVDGPLEADGYRWWKVETEDGEQGWAVELWLQALSP